MEESRFRSGWSADQHCMNKGKIDLSTFTGGGLLRQVSFK